MIRMGEVEDGQVPGKYPDHSRIARESPGRGIAAGPTERSVPGPAGVERRAGGGVPAAPGSPVSRAARLHCRVRGSSAFAPGRACTRSRTVGGTRSGAGRRPQHAGGPGRARRQRRASSAPATWSRSPGRQALKAAGGLLLGLLQTGYPGEWFTRKAWLRSGLELTAEEIETRIDERARRANRRRLRRGRPHPRRAQGPRRDPGRRPARHDLAPDGAMIGP